jgi:hypothetical protein
MIVTSSEVPGSDKAEDSDRKNVLNSQKVYFEDVRNINLDRHQCHRAFLISRIVFLLRRYRLGN